MVLVSLFNWTKMSGFRRHLMAEVVQRQFIEGYCVVGTQNYYLHIIQFTDEASYDTTRYYSVTPDANGYWRWYVPQGRKIKSLLGVCTRHSQANSEALVSIDFSHIDPVIEFQYSFGLYGVNIFYPCTNLKSVKGMRIVSDNTLGASCFISTFRGCTSLEYVDVRGWKNTTKATSISYVFRDCTNLTMLDGQDEWALRVSIANAFLRDAASLEEIDMSNFVGGASVTDSVFSGCTNLRRIKWGNLHFTATTMQAQFLGCESLEEIDLTVFSGSQPGNFNSTFNGCASLEEIDLSPFGTCVVTSMQYAFASCIRLKSVFGLDKLNVANCTTFANMCAFSQYLEDFDIHTWKPISNASFQNCFRECYALKINAGTVWDVSDASAIRCDVMYGSGSSSSQHAWAAETGKTPWADFTHLSVPTVPNAITNSNNFAQYHYGNIVISTCGDIEKTLSFIYSTLDLASAVLILQKLQDVTSYGGETLTFSATTSALVQADTTAMNLVAQAQVNGWTITFN